MRVVSHPAFAFVQFVAVLYAVHFSPLYEAALENPPVHAFEHALFLSSALAFWWPILAVAPAPRAPEHAVRLLVLFLALPASAFLGFILYVMRAPLYAHYAAFPGGLADQQNAGAVMWIAGGGPILIALLWCVADWGARRGASALLPIASRRHSMVTFLLAATMLHAIPNDAPETRGRELYTQNCSSCHGADLRGGTAAPSLIGVGAADVDFWVSTGRMPAAVPWIQVSHRGLQPYLSPADETAIVRYVAAASPGPPIPLVATDGDAAHGRMLFQQNCQHCHGVDGNGGAIGGATWAPSLANATVTQLAEAVRVGPGEMPQFGDRQIDQRELDDIATYVTSQRGTARFTGFPIVAGGTVPEGMYGWLAAGILSFSGSASGRSTANNQKDHPMLRNTFLALVAALAPCALSSCASHAAIRIRSGIRRGDGSNARGRRYERRFAHVLTDLFGRKSRTVRADRYAERCEIARSLHACGESAEGFESPPMVNGRTMIVTTPFDRVYALDAVTGDKLWEYDYPLVKREMRTVCCDMVNRGVALYGTMAYVATLDNHVLALDAQSGAVKWNVAVYPTPAPDTR